MCGENNASQRREVGERITPACAGKTRHLSQRRRSAQDHPRVCGENQRYIAPGTFKPGSPPRVRGKLFIMSMISTRRRITPACAGKTLTGKTDWQAL